MKKHWKIFWIICAVLSGIAIILLAAGVMLGGVGMLRNAEDNKWIGYWEKRFGKDSGLSAETVTDRDSYAVVDSLINEFDKKNKISVDMKGMAVEIQTCETDQIIVDKTECREDLQKEIIIEDKKEELKIWLENDKLLHTNDVGILKISIPEDCKLHEIKMDVGAGYAELSDITAEEAELHVGAGQIIADNIITDKLKAECDAGEIQVDGTIEKEAEVECSIGEIILNISGEEQNFDYELACDAGELVLGGEQYNGLNNKVRIDNKAGRKIEADCSMGRIEVKFR